MNERKKREGGREDWREMKEEGEKGRWREG